MKKVFIVLTVALMSQSMIAQADTAVLVPQAVAKAFSTQFPQGKLKKWEQSNEGYVAVFKQNGKKISVRYSADGTWGSTETTIAPWLWNLPDSVKKGWRKTQYAGWKVAHITKIDKPGELLYALDVNNSPELDAEHVNNFEVEWMLLFNAKGELVKQYQVD
jgi:Putative beta-lactamase-inhibitor-like, PepSY-like